MILIDEGQSPLVLCLPHSGTDVPKAVYNRLNATGKLQADLAWRLERVFDFHKELDATVLRSNVSRFVIDLDRDPKTPVSAAMDPARALCPATTLDGKRVYQEGEEPGPTEAEQRFLLFYAPFHKALHQQIDRLLRKHRKVILVNCQSMRSHIKGVTDEDLPLVNIGSEEGRSCDPDLRNVLVGSFRGQEGYTVSVDRYTKGGFITHSFARPEMGVHAVTLLLAQRAYLRHESPPFEPDKVRMAALKAVLLDSLSRLIDWTGVSEPANDRGEVAAPDGQTGTGEDTEASEAALTGTGGDDEDAATPPEEDAEPAETGASRVLEGPASSSNDADEEPVRPLLVAE